MFHFLAAGGHLGLGAAVDDVHAFRAHAQGGAGGVHGHVAGAEHGHMLAEVGGGVLFGEGIGAAQVHAGQVFVGGEHPHQVLAGHAQEDRQTGAHADEDRVIFLAQFVHGEGAAAHAVEVEVHTGTAQAVHFGGHHVLGQTEGGDAVDEHAAGFVQGFEHVHLEAVGGADARTGQGGGTGADAGHLLALDGHGTGIGAGHLLTGAGGDVAVGHEAFQAADGDGLALGVEDALAFALVFLRADAAAHGGQAVGGLDDAVGGVEVAAGHFGDEVADGHFHGAALHAEGLFALQAAGGFLHGHLFGVAGGHFVEIVSAHVRGLAGHVHARSNGLFGLSFHGCSCTGRWRPFPDRGRRPDGGAVRRSPPCGRRIRGRPHRRTWSCRPRSRGRRRTCRCRPP